MNLKDRLRDKFRHAWTGAMFAAVCEDALAEITFLEGDKSALQNENIQLKSDLAKAREDALEEAAKLCDAVEKDWKSVGNHDANAAYYLAKCIRALKENKP